MHAEEKAALEKERQEVVEVVELVNFQECILVDFMHASVTVSRSSIRNKSISSKAASFVIIYRIIWVIGVNSNFGDLIKLFK